MKAPSRETLNFFEQVWEVVKLIPKGRATSYGAIAKYLGAGSSSRMVGWAMHQVSVLNEKIPAHRVVNRQGLLTGKVHFTPPEAMQQALEREGIKVVNDKIEDFEKVFWDPAKELL